MVRKKRERNIGPTYSVGWLAIAADGSQMCRLKSDCDDGAGADLAGVGKREWVGDGCRAGGSDEDRGVNEGVSNGTRPDGDRRFMEGDGGEGIRDIGRRAWWETIVE